MVEQETVNGTQVATDVAEVSFSLSEIFLIMRPAISPAPQFCFSAHLIDFGMEHFESP